MPKKTKNTLSTNKALLHQTIIASTAIIQPEGLIRITNKEHREENSYSRSISFNLQDINLKSIRKISFNMYLSFYKPGPSEEIYNLEDWKGIFNKNDIIVDHTFLDANKCYSKVVIKFPTGINVSNDIDNPYPLISTDNEGNYLNSSNSSGIGESGIPHEEVTVDTLGYEHEEERPQRTTAFEKHWVCIHRELHVFDAKLIFDNDTEKHLGEDIDIIRVCFWDYKPIIGGKVIAGTIKGKLNKAELEIQSNLNKIRGKFNKKRDGKKSK